MPFFDLPPTQLVGYRSATSAPADFDDFWKETLSEAAALPLAARFEPVDVGLPLVEVFDVSFAGFGGHTVRGWFIKPRGASSGLSAVVKFIGYNGGRGFPHEHLLWPSTGRAVLVMDTRGQGSGWSRGETADPVGSEPVAIGLHDPRHQRPAATISTAASSPTRCAPWPPRGSRPEVDPDRIAVCGGSQGGGITLAVAGLDPAVRAAMPDVPFLCDFRRAVGLAARDPYGEISRYLSVHRDRVDSAFATLGYFDGVNFAARAKAPALFSVALMDDICPPSTVYAAYNAYGGAEGDRELQLQQPRGWRRVSGTPAGRVAGWGGGLGGAVRLGCIVPALRVHRSHPVHGGRNLWVPGSSPGMTVGVGRGCSTNSVIPGLDPGTHAEGA